MTIFELMTQLSAFDADSIDMAAKATVQANIPGAKDIYMAWGKEKGIAAKTLEAAYKEAQRAVAILRAVSLKTFSSLKYFPVNISAESGSFSWVDFCTNSQIR